MRKPLPFYLIISLSLLFFACGLSGNKEEETAANRRDRTAPKMIELTGVAVDNSSITFTWTDPPDSDLDYIMISCSETQSISAGVECCTISALEADQRKKISAISVDRSGNISDKFIFYAKTTR